MSSARRTERPAARLRLRPAARLAGLSLRTRLVVILVALLALVSVAIGGITTVALRQFMIDRVDEARWARR
ncbi:hypothetical protein ABZ793_31190 [Micromonospora sp. NPDC047465]|uniref:hypothetical protein n=1 Tax=Micromonospora sp. NPDC047465 TaxID=3154813 RepID=UPI0033C22BC7